MSQLFKRFKRDLLGVGWLSFGLLWGLSLWSYSPFDPSLNSIGKQLMAKNYCGYFGSFLADLLYQGFGLSAWVLVIACLRMSYRGFAGQDTHVSRLRLTIAFLLISVVACLLNLYFASDKIFSGQIYPGGLLGLVIVNGLTKVFNSIGVTVILWATAAALLVFYTEKPLREIFALPLKWLVETKERLQIWVASMWQAYKTRQLELAAAVPTISIQQPSATSGKKFILKDKKQTREFLAIEKEEELAEEEEVEPIVTNYSSDAQPLANDGQVQRRKVQMKTKIQRRVANWELPKLSLLEDPPVTRFKLEEKEIKDKAKLLVEKLSQFSVRGSVVGIKPGPAVTLFEFKPAADVKISKITELADDLSLALSSESVRIIAPIPGRDVVGIETSNSQREGVFLKDILAQESFWEEDCRLPMALGRKADGEPKVVDLRKMPHLLVAGTTGSGKSVFVVSALTGLLFRHSPKTLKLIMVDPKQVDLAAFNNIPHLIMPPIREPKKAVGALRWAIREMEKRYRSMSKFGARGMESFNEMMHDLTAEQLEQHEKANAELDTKGPFESYYYQELPYIVIVVEEFGDLMAVDKANVEQAVVRLAQMARACGIHLVLAMQSPRKDVVTGLIKTNIPGRISFKVASKMDSRIILDESGAERLLARGDMLFQAPGVAKPERHHGPYLSEPEIAAIMEHWKSQGEPEYDPIAMRAIEGSGGGYDLGDGGSAGEENMFGEDIKDEMYDEILAYVATQKEVSASLLQRRFRLGYPRAARMIEIFESEGVVSGANGSKPRQVLVQK